MANPLGGWACGGLSGEESAPQLVTSGAAGALRLAAPSPREKILPGVLVC